MNSGIRESNESSELIEKYSILNKDIAEQKNMPKN